MKKPNRVEREREFHDRLAKEEFVARRLVHRLAGGFYNKDFLWKPVWRSLGNLKGKVVLDYGCAAGGFSFELAKMGAEVYGIDVSERLISLALSRRCQAPQVISPKFLIMDAHRLEFSNEFFDFVFGNGILHHLELEKAYGEVARVLKPNGKAFFIEPLDRHPALRLFRQLTPQARTADEKPLSFEDIEKARCYFQNVVHREIYLLAVLAAPLNLLSYKAGSIVERILYLVDKLIFKVVPQTRRYAWITLIQLGK